MLTQKLTIAIVCCGAAALALLNAWTEPAKLSPELVKASGTGVENDPVYMTGCQTHPRPIQPSVVYAAVVKNFVTLPCALEVPPPYAAIESEKRVPFK